MPTPQIVLPAMGDILGNFLFGFYETSSPTNEERTTYRRDTMLQACEEYLNHLVGPGDLLDSDVRSEFAQEAYAGFGSPINDRSVRIPSSSDDNPSFSFAEYNQTKIQHQYVTQGSFRDVALAIVNFQHYLDEDFYNSVAHRLHTQYKDRSLEDCKAMTIELGLIAAGCDAIRTFYAATGMGTPPLPDPPQPAQPAHFRFVSDYTTSPLKYTKDIAWGPFLTFDQLRTDVIDKFHLDRSLWKFASLRPGPVSQTSVVPTTCQATMNFFQVMYVPLSYFPRFLRVPGNDRHLCRGQIEPAAATYTATKHCRF